MLMDAGCVVSSGAPPRPVGGPHRPQHGHDDRDRVGGRTARPRAVGRE